MIHCFLRNEKSRRNVALWALLPWTVFVQKGGLNIPDLSRVRIALVKSKTSCSKPFQNFEVELAKSPSSRAKGLGGRPNQLRPDEGMLFVFDTPERSSFWMKNTLIPLQIGFFDTKGKLTESMNMNVEPDPARPRRFYNASAKVIAALEVAPGGLDQAEPAHTFLCVEPLAPADAQK